MMAPALAFVLLNLQGPTSSIDITILHTNDLHGHMLPFAYTEVGRSKTEQPSVGGAARRATLIRQIRAKLNHPSILIDAGDTFTRGPLTNVYLGIADVEAMNAVGYELGAIGNNEFKAKDAAEASDAKGAQTALANVVKRAKFPWVCANVTQANGRFLPGVKPYVIKKLGALRVGFLGLTTVRSERYPQTKGLEFLDPVETARRWLPKVREQADFVIGLTHQGDSFDAALVAQVDGFDAIVGGDSHTFLYKARWEKSPSGQNVPIVQDGEFGVNLGRVDLHLQKGMDGKWRIARFASALIPITSALKDATDVVKVVSRYTAPYQKVIGRIDRVGQTPEERARITAGVIAEGMKAALRTDFAVATSSGLFGAFHRKEITRYDIREVMPFKNCVSWTTFTGAELKALLANHKDAVSSKGAPDDAQTYRVAFIDFEASSTFKLKNLHATETDVRDAVELGLKSKKRG